MVESGSDADRLSSTCREDLHEAEPGCTEPLLTALITGGRTDGAVIAPNWIFSPESKEFNVTDADEIPCFATVSELTIEVGCASKWAGFIASSS